MIMFHKILKNQKNQKNQEILINIQMDIQMEMGMRRRNFVNTYIKRIKLNKIHIQ